MALVKVEAEVSKEAHELAQALVNIVKAVKISLADGFQAGQDLPLLITSAIAELPAAVQGLDQLGNEASDHLPEFVRALTLGGVDIAGLFLKK